MIEVAGLAINLSASGYVIVQSFTLAASWAGTRYYGYCCGPWPKEHQAGLVGLLLLGFVGGCVAAYNSRFRRIGRFALLVAFGVWIVTWLWMRDYLTWVFC
jgi:hypothetical protein